MNTRITVYVAVLLLMGSFTQLSAQGPGRNQEQMDRFRTEKVKFFNEKLELSDEVAEKFWPVHENLHNRRMKLNEEEKTLLTYFSSNSEHMTEEEVDETINKYLLIQKKRHDMDLKFHEKFVHILGKKKTMTLYSLDREFRMHILREFQGRHRGQGKQDQTGRTK